MRKTSEEITREAFGQGARWIGWEPWLKKQNFFSYIERKIKEGLVVKNRATFFLKEGLSPSSDTRKMIAVLVDEAGDLRCLSLPAYTEDTRLEIFKERSIYHPAVGSPVTLPQMFEDPLCPTFEELDLFNVVFGDEHILLDIQHEFLGTVKRYQKAYLRGDVKILFEGTW